MKRITKTALSLTLAFQIPALSFAEPQLNPDTVQKAVELARVKANRDLQQVSQSLLQLQNSMASIRTDLNRNADGTATKYFKVGTAITSSLLIAGGVLLLTKPKLIKPEAAVGYMWLGSTVGLANSLVTIYGTGKLEDWKTSDILKAKAQNRELLTVLDQTLNGDSLDNASREQVLTLKKLSTELAQVLEKEDRTLLDKSDKALAALHLVAFVWGFLDANNMGAVKIGSNYVSWGLIETALTVSFAAMKNVTGLSLILDPADLKKVNQSLDATLTNLDLARMKLQKQIDQSGR